MDIYQSYSDFLWLSIGIGTYMQVNYRLAVGLFFMGAYKALRPLLICGLYAEKSRLAWNILEFCN